MTEHVYEYPLDDFEPTKSCMKWTTSNAEGNPCCPEGTHRHDCEIVQGYQKQRLERYDAVPMTTREKMAFTAAILLTLAGIGMVLA